ncbi:MAG: protein translocase subunit SecF [Alphaproteobacteria bacterium]|nr:protein translocase subunit SecF [Alphaproteobacteria bacterium]
MRHLYLVPKHTNIDFVGLRWIGFSITGLTMLVALVALIFMGLNLGIDFTGGVVIKAERTQGEVDFDHLRDQLDTLGFGDVALQEFGTKSQVLIRIQPSEATMGQEQQVVATVTQALGTDYKILGQDVVGPKVSGELFTGGVIACLAAVAMIALYVAFRFEWQFGVAAFIATFHDVFVTVGLYSVTQLTFDLTSVAAVLTLAGYSINDTVVVFDRIRENRRKFKKMPLSDLINLSTNQTLARTVMTSVCTALSVIPMIFFGGETLFGFSVSIMFGIVIGTYSSIYVASALLLYMPAIGTMEKVAPPPAARAARP